MLSQDLQQLHSYSQTQGPGGGQQAEEEVETLLATFLKQATSKGAEQPTPLSTSHVDFYSLLLARQASPTPRGLEGFPRLELLLLVSDNVTILLC